VGWCWKRWMLTMGRERCQGKRWRGRCAEEVVRPGGPG